MWMTRRSWRRSSRPVVRALDNVIDLNFFPVPYAKVNNLHYRPIGLGVSGYHHLLAKSGIAWESEAHLDFVDSVFERYQLRRHLGQLRRRRRKGPI